MSPAAAMKRIYAETAKLLHTPEVKTAFERVGTYVEVKSPAEFRDYVKSEYAKWGKVVRDVHLQIN